MAFRLVTTLREIEYRGRASGTSSKSGNRWMSLIFEDTDTQQLNVSVPSDMQDDVIDLGLRKGELCNVSVLAVARSDGNSYIQLRAIPEPLEEE